MSEEQIEDAYVRGFELDKKIGTLNGTLTIYTYDNQRDRTSHQVESLPVVPASEGARGGSAGVSDAGGAAVAAVGAAATAATGIYFCTHHKKVEAIKELFADLSANVQSWVQELTSGIRDMIQHSLPGQAAPRMQPSAARFFCVRAACWALPSTFLPRTL